MSDCPDAVNEQSFGKLCKILPRRAELGTPAAGWLLLDTEITHVHNPLIIPYLPPKEGATGVVVIVCPGGGRTNLAIDHEGCNGGKLADRKFLAKP